MLDFFKNYLFKDKKEFILKIVLYFLILLSAFLYIENYFSFNFYLSFDKLYSRNSIYYLLIFVSIYTFIIMLFYFHNTEIEEKNDLIVIEKYQNKKYLYLSLSELFFSFAALVLAVFTFYLFIIFRYIIYKEYNYEITFKPIIIAFIYYISVLLLSIIHKIFKYNQKIIFKNNIYVTIYLVLAGTIIYMLIDIVGFFIIFLLIIVLIVISSITYKMICYILNIRPNKIKSTINKKLLSKKLVAKYVFSIIITFIMILINNGERELYYRRIEFNNYEYIIKTNSITETIKTLELYEDFSYLNIKGESVGYINNRELKIINTSCENITSFYNFEVYEKMENLPLYPIILPRKFKTIINKNVGENILVKTKDSYRIYTIYEYIENDGELVAFIDEEADTNMLYVKSYNNATLDENIIYGDIYLEENYNQKLYSSYMIRYVCSYIAFGLLIIALFISFKKEKMLYLREKEEIINKLVKMDINWNNIIKLINSTNYSSFCLSFALLFAIMFELTLKYKSVMINYTYSILYGFNFSTYFIYEIEIFLIFNIIILVINLLHDKKAWEK